MAARADNSEADAGAAADAAACGGDGGGGDGGRGGDGGDGGGGSQGINMIQKQLTELATMQQRGRQEFQVIPHLPSWIGVLQARKVTQSMISV